MNIKIIAGIIALFMILVFILAIVFPSNTQAQIIDDSEHSVRMNVGVGKINGRGYCTFGQKLLTYSLKNASMNCDIFNGTLETNEGAIWFTGRISDSFFSGSLKNGSSSTYKFSGVIEGDVMLGYFEGKAHDVVMPADAPTLDFTGVLVFIAVIVLLAIIFLYMYIRFKGMPSFLGGKKRRDTKYWDDIVRTYVLENYDYLIVPDSGTRIDPQNPDNVTGLYRITEPKHMKDRLMRVSLVEGNINDVMIDVPQSHIDEIQNSEHSRVPDIESYYRGDVTKEFYPLKKRKRGRPRKMPRSSYEEDYVDF